MTRRIVLQLADDTTETHCGECHFQSRDWEDYCEAFGTIHPRKRHPECRFAELRPETVEAIRTELFAPQHAAELADFERLFGGGE